MTMEWRIPDSFPSLSSAKVVSIDCETRDDDLKAKGPGVRRGGYIVGVSVTTDDGFRGYYPIRHDQGPNLDPLAVMRWLRRELAGDRDKIGAHILYDADYLAEERVAIGGRWIDVLNAEPLLDENDFQYSLDRVAEKHLGEGKLDDSLEKYCKERGWKGNPHSHIWRMPASVVGPYALTDSDLPIRIFRKQLPLLREQGLEDLFWLETRLTKLLLKMRRTGVRVDVAKLDRVTEEFSRKRDELQAELRSLAGEKIDVWAAESIARVFDRLGLPYARTAKRKQPSFPQTFLDRHEHPVARKIVEVRKIDKFIGTFLVGQLKGTLVGDRIHAQFNQLKGEDGGAVTGRFSSSNPNLQFIPVRDEEMGPLCRSMFIPEEGCDWGKVDMSQIEFRFFTHFATGPGSDEIRRIYNENPDADFHQMTADMAQVSRKEAKTVNFGIIYGMGIDKLCLGLGRSRQEGEKILDEYHRRIPFVKHMLSLAARTAESRGYVKTILGRRRRFSLYEPADWILSKKVSPSIKERMVEIVNEARLENPGIRPGVRRAGTHRALNAVIQGSSADQIKKAMVECDEAGIFDILFCHLTVHDELDVSIPRTKEGSEAFSEMARIMETTIPLKVPVRTDSKIGANWGET